MKSFGNRRKVKGPVIGTPLFFSLQKLKNFLNKEKKRVRLPPVKRLEELLAMTLGDGAKKSMVDEETQRKSKEVQEKRSACEKEKLKEILKHKLKEKRRRSSSQSLDEDRRGASASKAPRRRGVSPSASESSDGDDLVLKSELKRMSAEYDQVLRKLKLMQEENMQLKKKNDQLQELNMSLQTQLLSLLSANGSLGQNQPPTQKLPELVYHIMNNLRVETNEGGSLLKRTPPPQEKPDTVLMTDLQDHERVEVSNLEKNSAPTLEESNPSLFETPANGLYLHDYGNLMKWKDEQMELAPGIFIKRDQWLKIVSSKTMTVSRFTRNLAVSLWGSETLKERSVTGTACRRFKKNGIEAKRALTPIKVDAVQNGLRFWLSDHQKKEKQEVLKLSSTSTVRKMLSDKIMDLSKRQKNNL
ncbi:hypothetical protein AVEN_11164-1 [Araneus ventricosus]|uniref:BEN domain-containing protein n=1 Tax=Araneus ventricosus TaxID=182803 RepID=A0A4Y2M3Y0_ARAVE|nr:hypothetical protein AVEN_11164-1 [Araneus ventricosus]